MAEATLWDIGCKEGIKSISAGGATGIRFFDTITTGMESAAAAAAGTGDLLNRVVSVNITLDSASISDKTLSLTYVFVLDSSRL
jgi:hypothetical protein